MREAVVSELRWILIGDWHQSVPVVIKAAGLFLTAAVLFRFKERRTMAEFAPYDWVAAIATGRRMDRDRRRQLAAERGGGSW